MLSVLNIFLYHLLDVCHSFCVSLLGCRGLFESWIMEIYKGIINVEVQDTFGIGCFNRYGISGLNIYSGAEKRGKYTAPLTIKLNGLPLSNMPCQ